MARTKQTARCAYVNNAQRPTHPIARNRRARSRSRSGSQDSHKSVEVNGQQFSVKFDNQKECEAKALPPAMIECSQCKAFLNSHSIIIDSTARRSLRSMDDAEKQLQNSVNGKAWECEFCKTVNQLPSSFQGLPQENPCYLLEKERNEVASESNKENLLIYCIDISGSMDQQFEGKTRLEAVQEAISDELKRMKFQKQKTQVAVVTFGSVVTIYNSESVNVPSQHYNNFQAVIKFAKTVKKFSFSLNQKFKELKEYVSGLATYGSTALGPGLLASIELAATGKKGSKIILCTDGEANIGLNGPEFYTRAAQYAKQKGVVVNILSIKGDNCNLKELGKLTLSTGGSILKIDPTLLGGEFNKISKVEVLGSESTLKIIVNRLFEIQSSVGTLSPDKTALTQDYGSFNAETELTFNFKVLSKEEAGKKGVPYEKYMGKKAPMQVQLTYTSPSGARYLQVITDYRELSENKEDVLKGMNFGLFAASTLQRISGLIRDSNFDEAAAQIQAYNRTVQEIFSKKEQKKELDKFNGRVRKLEQVLNSKKNKKSNPTARKTQRLVAQKLSKTKKTKKEKTMKRKTRRNQSDSDSSESGQLLEQQQDQMMASDSQEEILYREMRARSRSRSRSRSVE